jgi:CRISPR/Cas system-associated exonuclease Cas4 (RecB family)
MLNITAAINKAVSIIGEKSLNEVMVTEIAGCLRAAYYGLYVGRPYTEKMVMGLDNHQFFANQLAKAIKMVDGVDCALEYEVSRGVVRGRVDLLCGGEPIELKFTSVPSKSNTFYSHYVKQLMYYMALLGAKTGHLVMVSFDFRQHTAETFTLDDEQIKKLLEEIDSRSAKLLRAKQLQIEPEPERGPYCGFCRYKNICFNSRLEV